MAESNTVASVRVVTRSAGDRPEPSNIFSEFGSMPCCFQKSCNAATPFMVDGVLPDFQAMVFSSCSAYRLILFWLVQ